MLGYLDPELTASSTAAAAAAAAVPPTPDPDVERFEPPVLAGGRLLLETPEPDICVPPIPNGGGSLLGG